jgi:hypothetical protein
MADGLRFNFAVRVFGGFWRSAVLNLKEQHLHGAGAAQASLCR